MPELLAEQRFNVRLVINHENEEVHAHAPALLLSSTGNLHETEKLYVTRITPGARGR
jgi:hypothetical protein